jgi:hypothetical protein
MVSTQPPIIGFQERLGAFEKLLCWFRPEYDKLEAIRDFLQTIFDCDACDNNQHWETEKGEAIELPHSDRRAAGRLIYADGDLLGFGFVRFRNMNLQDTIAECRIDAILLDCLW